MKEGREGLANDRMRKPSQRPFSMLLATLSRMSLNGERDIMMMKGINTAVNDDKLSYIGTIGNSFADLVKWFVAYKESLFS